MKHLIILHTSAHICFANVVEVSIVPVDMHCIYEFTKVIYFMRHLVALQLSLDNTSERKQLLVTI